MGDLLGTLGGLLFSTGGASGHGSSRARCLGEIFFQLRFPPGSLRTHQKEVFLRSGALTETRKFSLGKKFRFFFKVGTLFREPNLHTQGPLTAQPFLTNHRSGLQTPTRSRGSVHRKKSIFLSFASRDQGSSSGWDHQFFQTFRFSF